MKTLDAFPVFLSASVPQDLVGTGKAQRMFDLIVSLVGGILSHSGTIIFGGHPTITPLIHRLAYLTGIQEPQIKLFQLKRFKNIVPEEIYDDKVFRCVTWLGSEWDNPETLVKDLAEMRHLMVRESKAAIFMGGKTTGFSGNIPGVCDEFTRFSRLHPKSPYFLIGMFEGETLNLINKLDDKGGSNIYLPEREAKVLRCSENVDLIAAIVLKNLQKANAKIQGF